MSIEKNKLLNVYLYNNFVGQLYFTKGFLSFNYDLSYLKSSDAKQISFSIPLSGKKYEHNIVEPFFSGLLPEESVRRKIAKYLHISYQNTFAMLDAIGGECAGAIALYKVDHKIEPLEEEYNYLILDDNEAYEILSNLDKHPMMVDKENIRISGAGAQDKLIVSIIDNKIAIPLGNTPSTYIIKPDIEGFKDTVENEFFCMQLAKNIGLPVPKVEILRLKDKKFYLIERYDRKVLNDNSIVRLHQEDFCQALHIPPIQKYQNEGGPSLKDCFHLLDEKIKLGLMPGNSKLILLQGVIFNFLIGNGDAHGKNFSILYEKDKESLAPFYDMLSTLVYFGFYKSKMAMKIGKKYKFTDINLHQFENLSNDIGFKFDFVKKQINKMAEKVKKEADSLLQSLEKQKNFKSDICNKIVQIINEHAKIIT